jgi:cell division protein FtsB
MVTNSIKKTIVSVFLGILIILFIAFLVNTNMKISKRKAELSARVIDLKQKVALLEEKNIELNDQKSYMGSQEYLEKVAREQLDMKKLGEEVLVVQKSIDEQEKKGSENSSWWEKIKSIFVK